MKYISTREAAKRIGISSGTLVNWRCNEGFGPKHKKIGYYVVYSEKEVDRWKKKYKKEGRYFNRIAG